MRPEEAFRKLSESIQNYDEDFGLTSEELYGLGLTPWGKEDGSDKELWLFPQAFYAHIPAGFPLVFISWKRGEFMPHQTDDDTRYGYLAYGVLGRVKK